MENQELGVVEKLLSDPKKAGLVIDIVDMLIGEQLSLNQMQEVLKSVQVESRKLPIHEKASTKRAIDCMVQHIRTFHIQACEKAAADFGKPCETCPFIKECNFDWISIMEPLYSRSSIKFKLEYVEQPNK